MPLLFSLRTALVIMADNRELSRAGKGRSRKGRLESEDCARSSLGLLGLRHPGSPAPYGDAGPYGLDQSERPRALQEAVDRPQRARTPERQDKPRAAILQRIADQHGGDGKQT